MDSSRKKFVIAIVAFAVLVSGWMMVGTSSEEVPYVSIQALEDDSNDWHQSRFRLGGIVEEGSIDFSTDGLTVDFNLQQDERTLPVTYSGLTPDMFADGAEVIIVGEYTDGQLIADELMTKCASRYEAEIQIEGHDSGQEI